jgi:hypothetical protein
MSDIAILLVPAAAPILPRGNSSNLNHIPSDITTTALANPDGSVVLYVYNGAASTRRFQIIDARDHTGFTATMVPGELSTFAW